MGRKEEEMCITLASVFQRSVVKAPSVTQALNYISLHPQRVPRSFEVAHSE